MTYTEESTEKHCAVSSLSFHLFSLTTLTQGLDFLVDWLCNISPCLETPVQGYSASSSHSLLRWSLEVFRRELTTVQTHFSGPATPSQAQTLPQTSHLPICPISYVALGSTWKSTELLLDECSLHCPSNEPSLNFYYCTHTAALQPPCLSGWVEIHTGQNKSSEVLDIGAGGRKEFAVSGS